MAEFFAEIIVKLIADILLFYPGAAIRWIFLRKIKSFNELNNDSSDRNPYVGALFMALLVVVVFLVKYYSR